MIAAIDLNGIASIIKETALLVTAVGIFLVSWQTHRKVTQIDAAVNGKPPGAATIGEEVTAQAGVLPVLLSVAKDVRDIKAAKIE